MISSKAIYGGSSGFSTKVPIATTQNWTVPAGIYRCLIKAIGGGTGGQGKGTTASAGAGVIGGASSSFISFELDVTPGDILGFTIGVGGGGGVGGAGGVVNGTPGTETTVALNGITVCRAGQTAAGAAGLVKQCLFGADGGFGGLGGAFPSVQVVKADGDDGVLPLQLTYAGGSVAPGGIASSGGGGGNSFYGKGGDGGAEGSNGLDAPSTSYGAGGGGAGNLTGPALNGGNGSAGYAEVLY